MSDSQTPIDFTSLVNNGQTTNQILTAMLRALLNLGTGSVGQLTLVGAVTGGSGAITLATTFESIPGLNFIGNIGGGSAVAGPVAFSGDFINSGGSLALNSLVAAGTVGSGSVIPIVGVNAEGRIVSLASATIASSFPGPGIAVNAGTISSIQSISAQTGITFTAGTADAAILTTFSNAADVAIAVPQAGTAFPANQWADYLNIGGALATFTPATSKVNGQSTLILQPYQGAHWTNNGTDYFARVDSPLYVLARNALSTRIPNNGTLGGNARGSQAIDIQPYGAGGAATNVASGTNAIAIGGLLTASGSTSTAIGYNTVATATSAFAAGNGNTASGIASVAIGATMLVNATGAVGVGSTGSSTGANSVAVGNNVNVSSPGDVGIGVAVNITGGNSGAIGIGTSITSNGANAISIGQNLRDRQNVGAILFGNGALSGTAGQTQPEEYIFFNSTTAAAAARLTTDGNAASSGNIASLAHNSSALFTADIILRDATSGAVLTYTQATSLITQGASTGATAMSSGNPAIVAGPTTATPPTLQAAPTVTADTGNGGFNISYQPPIGNTDTWHAEARVRLLYLI